ncbi:hypothetical protein GT2_34_00210 [Parageobacillus thermoglucosidasius NBRC 107763]|nr:hypothetical protein GT2_34_00210 [Parageobacillus thermoglucosidasius NBRC 107763]
MEERYSGCQGTQSGKTAAECVFIKIFKKFISLVKENGFHTKFKLMNPIGCFASISPIYKKTEEKETDTGG